jgi:hypothetical protein
MRVEMLSLGVGLLAGVGLRWMSTPAPPPEPQIVLEVTHALLPEACPERKTALQAELGALRREREALALTARMLEAQRVEREGNPVPWPEDPGDLAPAVFEAALRASLEASGEAELVSLDCEEYPCIAAVLSTTTRDNGDVPMTPFEGLVEQLTERGYHPDRGVGGIAAGIREGEKHRLYELIVFGAEEEPRNTKIRTQFRLRKLNEQVKPELEER